MASLKDLRRRIRATTNMGHIFKAMEMVAASKLRRAQARAQAAAPYAAKMSEMLEKLAGAAGELDHPLFKVREVRNTVLLVVTADRGFAGNYSITILRAAEQLLRSAAAGSVQVVVIGRKGRDYLRRRGYPILAAHTDVRGETFLDLARRITDDLAARFVSGEVDRVEILYTHFVNALVRRIVHETFLPVGGGETKGDSRDRGTLFEPDAETIFAELLSRYAVARLYAAVADSQASEESARMVAMGSARKNAGELVDALTLRRNRLRQAAITREISELVGGAEALK
ncbi:MAG: ATP synthase F1 subunit gamma [Candidatus Eisenbacteria bacterium]